MPAWPKASATPSSKPRSGRSCRRTSKGLGASRCRSAPPSDFIQRRQQILDQVVRVLEPGREAHQPVADAELSALRRRQALVGGRGRMRDQALGVAQIVGDADELETVEEAEGA